MLVEVYEKAGQTEEGLTVLAEALEVSHTSGERYYETDIHRLRGQLLLMQGGDEAE